MFCVAYALNFSDGIEWFLYLLAAYKQHKTHILEILSKYDFKKTFKSLAHEI